MPEIVVPIVYLVFIGFVGGLLYWQRIEKMGGRSGKLFYYYLFICELLWIGSLGFFGLGLVLQNVEILRIFEKGLYWSLGALAGIFPVSILVLALRSIDEKNSVAPKISPLSLSRKTEGFDAVISGFFYLVIFLQLFSLMSLFFFTLICHGKYCVVGLSVSEFVLNLLLPAKGGSPFLKIFLIAFVSAGVYSVVRFLLGVNKKKSGKMKK